MARHGSTCRMTSGTRCERAEGRGGAWTEWSDRGTRERSEGRRRLRGAPRRAEGAVSTQPGSTGIDGSGTERARCVLAPNPSPMTLDGTNTWVVAEPGSTAVIVIDPGPEDEGHLRRVLGAAVTGDRRVAQVVLTHGHPDHAAGAATFA